MSKITKNDILKFNKVVQKLKFMDAKVLSDNEVKISEKTIGGKVELVDAEGNLVAIENGTYEVDGFRFVVIDGTITEIFDEMEEVTEGKTDEVEETVIEETTEIKEQLNVLEEKIEVLSEAIEESFKMISKFANILSEANEVSRTNVQKVEQENKFKKVQDTLKKLTGK